jgi:hypothetical protein
MIRRLRCILLMLAGIATGIAIETYIEWTRIP